MLTIDSPEEGGAEQLPNLPDWEDFVPPLGSLMLLRTLDEFGGCELRSTRGSAEVKAGVKRVLMRYFHVDVIDSQPEPTAGRNKMPIICDDVTCINQYVASRE